MGDDQEPMRVLAERMLGSDLRPHSRGDADLGEGDGEATVGDVVEHGCLMGQPGRELDHGRAQVRRDRRGAPAEIPVEPLHRRTGEVPGGCGAGHPDFHAGLGPCQPRWRRRHRVGEAEDADHRCGVDVDTVGLVVEGDVAADDGDPERLAGRRHPLDGLPELPHHLRLLRIPEVQVVDEGERPCPGDGDIERRLVDETLCTDARVEMAQPSVAVCRHCQGLLGPLDPEQRPVGSRADQRC